MKIKVMMHPARSAELAAQKPIDSNVAGEIRWDTIVEHMRDGGSLTPKEDVEAFVITNTGIQFFVKRKP